MDWGNGGIDGCLVDGIMDEGRVSREPEDETVSFDSSMEFTNMAKKSGHCLSDTNDSGDDDDDAISVCYPQAGVPTIPTIHKGI